MPTLDSYRKSAFLQNEPGSHLDEWRSEAYWKSVQSQSGTKPPKGWNHHVLEPPERALDYLDWLNHRYPRKPYLLRRLLLPTWLLAPILDAVSNQQIARIRCVEKAQPFDIEDYAAQSKAWEYEIQNCIKRSAWIIPLMRAIRLNSEWLRAREKLIQASIEASQREAGSVPEPIELHATPWDQPGISTWKAKAFFQKLLARQIKTDEELFIVLAEFESSKTQRKVTPKYQLSVDQNPRKSRNHYVFENHEKCIDYLIWLNHRHPNWPYPLRRFSLPIRKLTRFIESICQHQIAQLEKGLEGHAILDAYPQQVENCEKQLASCIDQNPFAIPMMRVVRLNAEWLQERQALITAAKSKTKSSAEQNLIEIRSTPWKFAGGKHKPLKQILLDLLSLQRIADKQLSVAMSKDNQ